MIDIQERSDQYSYPTSVYESINVCCRGERYVRTAASEMRWSPPTPMGKGMKDT